MLTASHERLSFRSCRESLFRCLAAWMFLAGLLLGCRDSVGPRPSPAPSTLIVLSGDNQRAVAGALLAQDIVVVAADAQGTALVGVELVFALTSGAGGEVEVGRATTGNDGRARFRWRLPGVTGQHRLVVHPASAASLIETTVDAIATTPPGAFIVIGNLGVARTVYTDASVPDLSFGVHDAGGAGLPGVTVRFSTGTAGGTVSPATVITGAGGERRRGLVLGGERIGTAWHWVTNQPTDLAAARGRQPRVRVPVGGWRAHVRDRSGSCRTGLRILLGAQCRWAAG